MQVVVSSGGESNLSSCDWSATSDCDPGSVLCAWDGSTELTADCDFGALDSLSTAVVSVLDSDLCDCFCTANEICFPVVADALSSDGSSSSSLESPVGLV